MLKKAIIVLSLVLQVTWLSGCTRPGMDEDVAAEANKTTEKPLSSEHNSAEQPDTEPFHTIMKQAQSAVNDIKPIEEKTAVTTDTETTEVRAEEETGGLTAEPDLEATPKPLPQPKVKPADIQKTEPKTEIADIDKEEVKPEKKDDETHVTDSKQKEKPKKKPVFYEKCGRVFSTFVDKNGNVDYTNLKRKRIKLLEASKAIEEFIPENMTLTENEEITLWINAHNIYTLKLIIDNYPIESLWYLAPMYPVGIMHIPGGRDKTYFKVMGREYTLKEIEKEQLLSKFHDPRICFALSFASMGGAYLRNETYYPEKIDEQLQEQVKKFINSDRGLKIDSDADIVYLSDIFFQYKDTFIAKYSDIKRFREKDPAIRAYLNFIIDYLPEDKARYLELGDYIVKFIKYDWTLNDRISN